MDNKIDISSLASLFVKVYYNDTALGNATAFIVGNKKDGKYLITNRHVVTGRNNFTNKVMNEMGGIPNKLHIQIPRYEKERDMFIWNLYNINLYNSKEEKLWLEHPIYKSKVDVVAIKLKENTSNIFYSIEESNYLCSISDNVKIIGYPFGYNINPRQGYYAIWISGTIASEPLVNLEIEELGEEMPAFLIDARTREGASGSPVIYYNRQGIVMEKNGFSLRDNSIREPIGIYSGRIRENSDLGIVWKWRVIKEIINQ